MGAELATSQPTSFPPTITISRPCPQPRPSPLTPQRLAPQKLQHSRVMSAFHLPAAIGTPAFTASREYLRAQRCALRLARSRGETGPDSPFSPPSASVSQPQHPALPHHWHELATPTVTADGVSGSQTSPSFPFSCTAQSLSPPAQAGCKEALSPSSHKQLCPLRPKSTARHQNHTCSDPPSLYSPLSLSS